MGPNGGRQVQFNFSGMGCWLTLAAAFILLTTVGIGWLLKSLLVLVVLLLLLPVVLIFGVQFWLKRNLVEGKCPVCTQPLTGFKAIPMTCPSCGTRLQVVDSVFTRVAPEGTIDVDVVDVNGTTDNTQDIKTVDIEVLPPADSQ